MNDNEMRNPPADMSWTETEITIAADANTSSEMSAITPATEISTAAGIETAKECVTTNAAMVFASAMSTIESAAVIMSIGVMIAMRAAFRRSVGLARRGVIIAAATDDKVVATAASTAAVAAALNAAKTTFEGDGVGCCKFTCRDPRTHEI